MTNNAVVYHTRARTWHGAGSHRGVVVHGAASTMDAGNTGDDDRGSRSLELWLLCARHRRVSSNLLNEAPI
jgi:hypothetical protein